VEIRRTILVPDKTICWPQQEEMHSKYTDLTKVACNIFSIIPHGVGVEASSSLRREVIGWRQSKLQARPFTNRLLCGSLIEPLTGYWHAITQHWIQQIQKTTQKWRTRQRKEHFTEWPMSTMCWRCDRADNTSMLHSRNLTLNMGRWLLWRSCRDDWSIGSKSKMTCSLYTSCPP